MSTRIATHTYHTLDYYYRLLTTLIASVKRRLSHTAIADALNEQGIPSPTGRSFNRQIVANTLRHLRLHEEHRPLVYHAMLQLCFDGRISHEDCQSLLDYRPGTL